ncbi:dTDP-glucose 4,6-dehydratase [bacterium]|nr:dTDP-glucose 4,6-dehydratase [Candidatus Elulimicrobium humile]
MKNKILVTGGAGFMGSYFIKYLIAEHPYVEIINFDALTYAGNLENLNSLVDNGRYTFIKGDITDIDLIDKTVQDNNIELIVNFAAETHVDNSIKSPLQAVNTNIMGVASILEVVRKYNIELLQISTDEVFGTTDTGSFTEQSPFVPNSPYSAAKAGGDLLCRAYNETYGTKVIVTHSCNVMGPNQYPEKLIPLAITNLMENKKIPLYGDGLNVREWIYVEDHSRAIEFIMEKGTQGEVYNIGTGFEITNLDLITKLLQNFGLDIDRIEYVTDRPAHDRRYSIDSTKLRNLGWSPYFDFDTAIRKTIAWYTENQNWWQSLKINK